MNFVMIGLDYKSSAIDIREKISLTHNNVVDEIKRIHNEYGFAVTILSTCNRTEIYLSDENYIDDELIVKIFYEAVNFETSYYIKRDTELIDYLFELSCGMHSLILGEDQIITQVNDATELSTKNNTGNSALNTLFRHSVTCAKKAKTKVNIKFISPSIVSEMIDIIKKEVPVLTDKKVLVIGNGEIGRLAAILLIQEKCSVCMTLRQYKYHANIVPENCNTVNYDEREKLYSSAEIIVSATKSPHFTVHFDSINKLENKPKYFFDMALPRDIEPEIRNIEGVNFYDVDDIGKDKSYYDVEAINQIKEIILEQKVKFKQWLDFYKNIQNK